MDAKELTQSLVDQRDPYTDFLAHYGVKGQKWGIRRAVDGATGLINRRKTSTDKGDAPDAAKTSGGSTTPTSKQQKQLLDATEKKLGRKLDDSEKEAIVNAASGKTPKTADDPGFISVDAQRHLNTRGKDEYELGDAEITAAINRANKIKQYNDLFAPDANQAMIDKVAALDLEKRYRTLQAELKPPGVRERATQLISAAGKGYEVYQKLPDTQRAMINESFTQAINISMGKKADGSAIVREVAAPPKRRANVKTKLGLDLSKRTNPTHRR